MTSGATPRTSVVVFCGGRGARTIAAALVGDPLVDLHLIVNGYDNGLSTGALRAFVPGMLGLSDFRKNLGHHLAPDDPIDRARLDFLDYRLPRVAPEAALAAIRDDLANGRTGAVEPWCAVEKLGIAVCGELGDDLDAFAAFARGRRAFDYSDCSVANLCLTGAFLRLASLDAAVTRYAKLLGSTATVWNVTTGENLFLAAVKEDGELLADEADIVAPQSSSPIQEIFLLAEPLTAEDRAAWCPSDPDRGLASLRARAVRPRVNPRVDELVRDADVIVFGPGTQHSSLLPSYQTTGLADALAAASAPRVLILNLTEDHDNRGRHGEHIVAAALRALGDPDNRRQVVTHVAYHDGPLANGVAVPLATTFGARWLGASLADRGSPVCHDGRRTVDLLRRVLDERKQG